MAKSRFPLFVSVALAILAAGVGDRVFSAERAPGGNIDCKWPISPDETGLNILKRYGKHAKLAFVRDLDGEGGPGLQLYPDDPTLRFEIEGYGDVIRSKPATLYLREIDSKWSAFGLKVGMTLQEAAAALRSPLDLSGFERLRDGGPNTVTADFPRGKLAAECRVLAVFSAPEDKYAMLRQLDNLEHIPSDNPQLLKINPILSDLLILWDPPEE